MPKVPRPEYQEVPRDVGVYRLPAHAACPATPTHCTKVRRAPRGAVPFLQPELPSPCIHGRREVQSPRQRCPRKSGLGHRPRVKREVWYGLGPVRLAPASRPIPPRTRRRKGHIRRPDPHPNMFPNMFGWINGHCDSRQNLRRAQREGRVGASPEPEDLPSMPVPVAWRQDFPAQAALAVGARPLGRTSMGRRRETPRAPRGDLSRHQCPCFPRFRRRIPEPCRAFGTPPVAPAWPGDGEVPRGTSLLVVFFGFFGCVFGLSGRRGGAVLGAGGRWAPP